MSDNVVALPGFKLPTPQGRAVAEVVEILEELLDMAKAGDLVAFAGCFVIDDGSDAPGINHRAAARQGSTFTLAAALRRMNYYFDETFIA